MPSLALFLKKACRCLFKKELSFTDNRLCSSPRFQQFSLISDQFLNTFHGCYRDGTDSMDPRVRLDCRWFAGFYFILRLVLFAVFAFMPSWYHQYFAQLLVCVVALLLIVVLRPYKNDLYNTFDTLIFMNLATLSAISMYNFHMTVVENTTEKWTFIIQHLLIYYPLVHIVLYILWRRLFSRKTKQENQHLPAIEGEGGNDDMRERDLEFSQHVDTNGEQKPLLQQRGYGTITRSVVAINVKHSTV